MNASTTAFDYDVAISFAGEQRAEAEAIARCLRDAGVRVFYDHYEAASLWGKDLYEHLTAVYEHKARYCLMLVSAAYATKVWTTHERKSAQARALRERMEYVLPVRFDDTEVPGLLPTTGYLRYAEHGPDSICAILLTKLQREHGRQREPSAVPNDPPEYAHQRKQLPDTEIMERIWALPRWRIWICAMQFKTARFRDLEHCRSFMQHAPVTIHSWYPYPWVASAEIQTGNEWIAGEIDQIDGRVHHLQRWVLFRSGQFVHNWALDDIPARGNRVHVLRILDATTAVLEFAARMAQERVLAPQAALSIELHGIAGRTLTWPQDVTGRDDAAPYNAWAQDNAIGTHRVVTLDELTSNKRRIAREIACDLYADFGWTNPPLQRLNEEQERRFGRA